MSWPQQESATFEDIALFQWSLRELIEGAVRAGEQAVAAEARERLAERTAATPTPAALGIQALADALAGSPAQTEAHYREAIELLAAAKTAITGYRARLLFGGWLRRANRRTEARTELRAAYEAFTAAGADLFAERAGRELAATGKTVRGRQAGAPEDLTAREGAIVRLVAAGRTNPEIGAVLFLSPRTVECTCAKFSQSSGSVPGESWSRPRRDDASASPWGRVSASEGCCGSLWP